MRPSVLDPLFASIQSLPGVGDKVTRLFERLLDCPAGTAKVRDLLFHLPNGVIDRRLRSQIGVAPIDRVVTIEGRVAEHRPPSRFSKGPYRVLIEDKTGDCLLIFFRDNHQYIERHLPLGSNRLICGRMELWEGHRQIVHPDYVLPPEDATKIPAVEPVYGMTEGLFPKILHKAMAAALGKLPFALAEWLDPALLEREKWPGFIEALRALHHPETPEALAAASPFRRRLAYDELLAHQLSLALVRQQQRRPNGRAVIGNGSRTALILQNLPFALTGAQQRALTAIDADMAGPLRMLRLLQGDVGSGKTVVALLAMTRAVEAGKQAALMAPTDILARQHFERLSPLCTVAGISTAYLSGRDKVSERERTLAGLTDGSIDMVFGTHALFQDKVQFRDLALAVVDEQHRFGVEQRLALGAKGEAVDVLVMTATPIPRTLVLTHFGDMDVSILDEKPPGRQKIDTRTIAIERIGEIVAGLNRVLERGDRVYWICPLVSESEAIDLAAATERFETLQQWFGTRVALVHGQMPGKQRDGAMEAFRLGECDILVATTVVEVGVDIPEATIMVIEHAERFGLSQLHQLRGRIGRGSGASTCILLYKGPLGAIARQRLAIMRESEDGFRLAEEDLRLRGEGEVLGTRQSGLPDYHFADLEQHGEMLKVARDDARLIVQKDAHLVTPRGQALQLMLYLFAKQDAVRLLQAG